MPRSFTWARQRLTVVGALGALACTSHVEIESGVAAARTFLGAQSRRRAALEDSVAEYDTAYAHVRLMHYATSANDAWDNLPIFSRRVRPLRVRHAAGDGEDYRALAPEPETDALALWQSVGEDAFQRYPIQIDLALAVLRDRADAERLGFVVEENGVVRTLVEVENQDGTSAVSFTCATCHEATRMGLRVPGLPNDGLDLGTLFGTSWPIGTNDVSADDIDNPQRPSDLRPIAHQHRLHETGNLRNSPIARMVRIETLMLSQLRFRMRPQRYLAASLSLYLDSLEQTLPELRFDANDVGYVQYRRHCAGCHGDDARGGNVVLQSVIGTDERATQLGAERGTLGYRAPSLWGAYQRTLLLHDGSARTLEHLLGLDGAPPQGHPFLLDVDEESRRAIRDWLSAD